MAPFTSLSRTAAHEPSRRGRMTIPCLRSNPSAEATAMGAQSVSGMKPTVTSRRSGASEPPTRRAVRNLGRSGVTVARGRGGALPADPPLMPVVLSYQQIRRRDQAAGQVHQLEVAIHGHLAHGGVGGLLIHPPLLHEDALGALDAFTLGQRRARVVQLALQRLELLEAGDG